MYIKINKTLILLATFLLLSLATFAQDCTDGPGLPGDDPDAGVPCPLDTWVFVLAAVALIITTFYLYRRQKAVNI